MTATATDTRISVGATATLLREAYPTNTAKLAARAARVSHRTSEAWVSGRREPSAGILLRMAATCDRIADALQRRLDARQAAGAADHLAPHAGGGTSSSRDEIDETSSRCRRGATVTAG